MKGESHNTADKWSWKRNVHERKEILKEINPYKKNDTDKTKYLKFNEIWNSMGFFDWKFFSMALSNHIKLSFSDHIHKNVFEDFSAAIF